MEDNRRECCYAEMSSIEKMNNEDANQIHYIAPYQNAYEKSRPGSNGLDQSGMK